MNTTIYSKFGFLLCLLLPFCLISTQAVAQKKKSAAQLKAEREIDTKRSEVGQLKGQIAAKTTEINQKQAIFDVRKAEHAAEEQRIAAKDAAVKDYESCLTNLLADVLPAFAEELTRDYTYFRNHSDQNQKITRFAFAPKMMEVLTPAYKLAHKNYLTTFIETDDRAAFAAAAEERFDLYFLGGIDRSGDTLEGIFSDHFHPKNLPTDYSVAQPVADKYIARMKSLYVTEATTIELAKQMPIEFYVGWSRFEDECGTIVSNTMQDKRRKARIPEMEAQAKFGAALRQEFLHLETLKKERQVLEGDLYIQESNLAFLENNYFKTYKVKYK